MTAQPVIDSGEDVDISAIALELRARNIAVDTVTWDDPAAAWDDYTSIVIRSPWDYVDRYREFLAWLDTVEPLDSLLNCVHVIRWNLDKRYLDDLRGRGIPVVPTSYCTSRSEAVARLATISSPRVVIKSTISAGAKDTGLFDLDDPHAIDLVDRIVTAGKVVMLQPEIESVTSNGERALLYFDGTFSHAFHKGPILAPGGGLVGGHYQEAIAAEAPQPGEIALGYAALTAVGAIMQEQGCTCGQPLYARFDLVGERAESRVLEAELFEPALYLKVSGGSVARFVDALLQRDAAGLDSE